MNFLKNNRGAAAVEFALVALPVLYFILAVMQTAYIVWIANLLHDSVDTAARCGAVGSTTSPCSGSGLANMQSTANAIFAAANAAGSPTFPANNCSGSGLTMAYNITIVFVVKLPLTASSCYPTVVVSP